MYIRGIILAAGASSRMGHNKLQMKIGSDTIVNKVVAAAERSILDELVLIYGAYDANANVRKLYNEKYKDGISTSIKKGMEDFVGDGVMLILGDMPFIDSNIINKLYEEFRNSDKNIAVPVFDGKKGNPVIIGRKYFDELFLNTGDKGAKDIINNNECDVLEVEVGTNAIFRDIDEEKDLVGIDLK